ncbi:MAG: hypothetical protein QM736_20745 [Vicinamibacterales bacterium]
MEVRGVERIDVGTEHGAELARESRTVPDGCDAREDRLQRVETTLFDRGLVHEGGVVVAEFLLLVRLRRASGVFQDRPRLPFRLRGELAADAP